MLLLLSLSAGAKTLNKTKEVFVLRVSTDYDKSKTFDLMLKINYRGLIDGFKTRDNKKKKTKSYPVSIMEDAVPLVKSGGIKLVSLRCENFNTARGCDMIIRYPYNLTYGRFKEVKCQIKRTGRNWGIYHDGKKVTKMHMTSKKLLGTLVGIEKVELKP